MSKPLLLQYRENPLKFIEGRLGIKTWSGMRYIIDTVWNNKRTSVRACHGSSKTFCAAVIAVSFLNLYPNSIVITSAPTSRQVHNLLWKEIGGIYERHGNFLKGELTELKVKVAPEWYMIGFSTDNAVNVEGYHAPNILWILDEAKGLPQWLYDAVEGSMTGGNAKVLEISTTDGADQQTPFYKHHTRERGEWKTIHISAFDSPFVDSNNFDLKKYNIKICEKLYEYGKPEHGYEWPLDLREKIQIVDEDFIKDKEQTWYITRKDLWTTKICGNLSAVGLMNVIPLVWVESAINAEVSITSGEITYGVDVGAGGDPSVILKKLDKRVEYIYDWVDENTMSVPGEIIARRRDNGIVRIDMIGVGHGSFNRLAELGIPVIGIDSKGKPAMEKEAEYFNLRAQMWFDLRGLFERQFFQGNTLSIPADDELIEELTMVQYYPRRSDGKIQIEEKEDVKRRLGRSTNKADALVYACADLRGMMNYE